MMVTLSLFILSGCILEQQQPLGAKSEHQTFSNLGIKTAEKWQGPLTDMLVPDESIMGLTKDKNPEAYDGSNKRNLGMYENSQQHGLMNNQPGLIKDDYPPFQSYYLNRKHHSKSYSTTNVQEDHKSMIKGRLLSLENIKDVHVIETDNELLIGIESNETSMRKLERSVQNEIEQLDISKKVSFTTKRSIINRMEALENNINVPQPFQSFGGMMGEFNEFIHSQD
ncbi:hypothetical protein BTS2_3981 [Bacillus sp. TS-2]|nr:hypothetical protein BTS2_3981 [Bacillus sp. TS-2]